MHQLPLFPQHAGILTPCHAACFSHRALRLLTCLQRVFYFNGIIPAFIMEGKLDISSWHRWALAVSFSLVGKLPPFFHAHGPSSK